MNFKMIADDVLYISGRGAVVMGKIISGEIHPNDKVTVLDKAEKPIAHNLQARVVINENKKDDSILLLLDGITRADIDFEKGYIIIKENENDIQ
ncbi:MAG: hypothetical protein LUI06_06835 [Ruminococcus sp.]|nr:hypothetical protein [Ruminococcus sp.]